MISKNFRGSLFRVSAIVGIVSAVLAGLILNTSSSTPKSSARNHGNSQIAALSTALESYRAEYGDYPIARGDVGLRSTANANILYRALVVSNAAYNPSGKNFFEPVKNMCASTNYDSSSNYFIDPYGRPYQYRYPGDPQKSGTNTFDLFSYGKSGKPSDDPANWEAWIKNW